MSSVLNFRELTIMHFALTDDHGPKFNFPVKLLTKNDVWKKLTYDPTGKVKKTGEGHSRKEQQVDIRSSIQSYIREANLPENLKKELESTVSEFIGKVNTIAQIGSGLQGEKSNSDQENKVQEQDVATARKVQSKNEDQPANHVFGNDGFGTGKFGGDGSEHDDFGTGTFGNGGFDCGKSNTDDSFGNSGFAKEGTSSRSVPNPPPSFGNKRTNNEGGFVKSGGGFGQVGRHEQIHTDNSDTRSVRSRFSVSSSRVKVKVSLAQFLQFANGFCYEEYMNEICQNNGNGCTFKHTLDERGCVKKKVPKGRCFDEASYGNCFDRQNCIWMHDGQADVTTKSRSCPQWNKTGQCEYGENCKYIHRKYQANPGDCYDLANYGECYNPGRCKYNHDLTLPSNQAASAAGPSNSAPTEQSK